MVPNKFNVVHFSGFDLAYQYGEALPGIYDKIVDAHWNCVYIMCFGLKFAGLDIAPQYMTPEMFSDHIMLNGIISIDQNDVITIPSIEPPPPAPVILPGTFEENGTFSPPSGVDGFAPVTVNVSAQTPKLLPFGFLKIMRGIPRWDSDGYVIDSNQNRLGSNISTISFNAGDVIDIGDFDTYKFAIGTNNASTSAHGQVWINGGYITNPYTLLQADIADMKCLMIARVDNSNITDSDIQYIQSHGIVMRVN